MTVRIAYNLFTQRPGHELEDFEQWAATAKLFQGDRTYRLNGAGEMLVFSAADFEDMLQPLPGLAESLEKDLEGVVRLLAQQRWPFRLHATYNESITRFLNVFERVDREVPLTGMQWFFDHAETISDRNLERVAALGGGIAIQHRMAFQGEYFVDRYGATAARRTPPIRQMLRMGLPVGAGTDATRVATFNPFVSLYWLVSGKTVGGLQMYDEEGRLSREEALRLYTQGSSWFSTEQGIKGGLCAGQAADFAVLSDDYFSVPEEGIKALESVSTVVGGEMVYAADDFRSYAPAALPVAPDWAPTLHYGGYHRAPAQPVQQRSACCGGTHQEKARLGESLCGLGCDCFAF